MTQILIAHEYSTAPVDIPKLASAATRHGKVIGTRYYKSWDSVIADNPTFTVVTPLDDDFAGILHKPATGLIKNDHVIKVTTATIK